MKDTDYFGLYEKKEKNYRHNGNESFVLNLVDGVKKNRKIRRRVKKASVEKVEITPEQKLRQVEIEDIKSKLFLLRTTGSTQGIKIERLDEHRREELIYCKQVLESEGLFRNFC